MASVSSPVRPSESSVAAPIVPPDVATTERQSSTSRTQTEVQQSRGKLMTWIHGLPFLLTHVALIGLFWSGITWQSLVLCASLFAVGMFAITGGYHRYFSHRTFKTGRVFQFILAFMAEMTAQRGVLWWAAHHRHHHKHSDDEYDVHSPVQSGFWYSHFGWIFAAGNGDTKTSKVRDLAKYPELRFLDRFWLLPPTLLAVVCVLTLGLPGLFAGFFLSTVLLWHATFTINSLAHVIGNRRYDTSDDSRNNFLLALLTFGEGWHNNHHHYMLSARQGFYWWEIDITYYILKVLSWTGLVWDLREVPPEVLESGRANAGS